MKKCTFFFRKPFCDTLTNCPKKFSHPYTLFVFFKITKKHSKIWGKQAKNILDQVLTQPWTKFDSKKPKSWTKFWLYSIYIYIYMATDTSAAPKKLQKSHFPQFYSKKRKKSAVNSLHFFNGICPNGHFQGKNSVFFWKKHCFAVFSAFVYLIFTITCSAYRLILKRQPNA